MDNIKQRFTLWLSPELREEIHSVYRSDNCTTQSEFIEKALTFYLGYLHASKASEFLPALIGETLDSNFKVFQRKLGRLIFKQAVETNITNHILAYDTDIDLERLEKLRYRSVREVKESNGEITFEDNLKFQKSV